MNTEFFIAQKIHQGKNEDKKVSRPITRIAMISITLAVIINIVTIAVVTGFQNQVRDKVIGFGSHATVLKSGEYSTYESAPILRNPALIESVQQLSSVNHVQEFAYKPALLQSTPDTVFCSLKNRDTFQIQQQIHGVIVKGVGADFNWDFFKKHLKEGEIPEFGTGVLEQKLVISRRIARDLHLKLGDEINTFFIKNQPIRDKYIIAGIFETGLEELDKEIVIGDIRNVQQMNDWGIQAAIRVADTITDDGQLIFYADARGGNGNYRYDWGAGFEPVRGFTWCDKKDTTIRLVVSDYWSFIQGEDESTIPDTAYLHVSIRSGDKNLPCFPDKMEGKQLIKEYLNDSGTHFAITMKDGKRVEFRYEDGTGSHSQYIGGFEILVNEWNDLDNITRDIRQIIYSDSATTIQDFRVQSIKDDQQDIFLWLSFLDLNVIVILVLMIVVSTINMGSGLLVLILTKTNLIGLLKAIGASNWSIRKVFLYQAIFIIVRGVIYGNIIGISICYLQLHFNIIPLNPEVYYLNTVPVEMNYTHIVLLNVGTLILCTAALIVPSYVVTRIDPVKALKFD